VFAFVVGAVLAVASPAPPQVAATPATYQIDVSHSRLSFRIRHLVSRVEGRFDRWQGTLTTEPADFRGGKVEVSIEAASINTGNPARDNDLRSKNFFDAGQHPTIRFASTAVEQEGIRLRVHGNLTIRGVTRPVTLEGEFLGRQVEGTEERLGFEARTSIDRTAFGVSWNRAVEGGGVLLGDEVTIELTIAAVREMKS
jgi:polyisoprenoid-binding protein YceI